MYRLTCYCTSTTTGGGTVVAAQMVFLKAVEKADIADRHDSWQHTQIGPLYARRAIHHQLQQITSGQQPLADTFSLSGI